jgi:hypothetical protein
MGTRNLTCVIDSKGTLRVAQYGQWDGYPTRLGREILEWLKEHGSSFESFENKLVNVAWATKSDLTKMQEVIDFYRERFPNDDSPMKTVFPSSSRDTDMGVLRMIDELHAWDSKGSKLMLQNDVGFAGDGLFCEWAYVINLQTSRFEVYAGFNKGTRGLGSFEGFELEKSTNDSYGPVGLIAFWRLNDLPDMEEFLSIDVDEEEEEVA